MWTSSRTSPGSSTTPGPRRCTRPWTSTRRRYPPGRTSERSSCRTWAESTEFEQAAEAAHPSGTPTAAEILKGLYALPKGTTLGGIAPPLGGFVKGKPANNTCFYLMGINHGKFVTINDNKPVCPS